jgi:anti-sigma factor RsiW
VRIDGWQHPEIEDSTVKNDTHNAHLSAEQLQALLEGELPSRDLLHAEKHLTGCARCSGELDAWRVLFEDLGAVSGHRPHEGFADRVMASVEVPEPRSLGERLRERVHAGSTAREHPAVDVLQDFLEGSLAARRAESIEQHLGSCGPCAEEADAWLLLMRRLDGLEGFSPATGFSDRVMALVDVRERLPLIARVRRRFAGLMDAPTSEHVPAGLLQDFVDAALPGRAMARVEAHLGGCSTCAGEARAWQTVAARLDTLDRHVPSEGFGDRVLTGLREARARAALAPRPLPARLAAAARRLVPQTREAWAALSGIAVTPAVTVGLVFWVVFSHPTLTLGSLASFAWWQLSDVAGAAASALATAAVQSTEAFGAWSLVESLASAPAMVAGGVVAYTMICALALRVLYKNLIANRPTEGRYAHVSTAS